MIFVADLGLIYEANTKHVVYGGHRFTSMFRIYPLQQMFRI